MYKNLEGFIKLELSFCKKKYKEVERREMEFDGREYWRGRIEELTLVEMMLVGRT